MRYTRCETRAVMLATLKQTACRVSQVAGVSARIGRSAWRRARVLILCYHGVSLRDEHEWDPLLYVSPRTFARRLELIRRHACTVLPLAEARLRLYTGELPDRSVVITFDDGYFDFVGRAQPALQRHGFPATVYLTTQRCEHNYPIPRLLASYLLWRGQREDLDGRDLAGLESRVYRLSAPSQRRAVYERFCNALQPMRPAEKDAAVRALADRLAMDYDELRAERLLTIMSPADVAATAAAGVDFELHTHRHRTPEDPNALLAEISANRDRIASMTGIVPTHFCYPSGHWRPSYLAPLRSIGISSATTCSRGLAEQSTDPLLLPRLLDSESTTDDEFVGWLTGMADWMPRHAQPRVQGGSTVHT